MGPARLSCLLAALLVPVAPARAANVIFDATVAATCTLTVTGNGVMVADAALQSLSSKLPGGSAGTLSLSTTGGVEIGVDPVSGVTRPGSDTTPTTWTPSYSVSGSHTVAETSAGTPLAGPGLSTVTVHLVGTKSGAHSFTTGTYQATVTVRCE